ncbi:hypothetical protein [uncultured Winogradskyella sp.]|uniref:hypothetical protein n=1 Tax=uncultured Winogradskyella sp. TaxID=395353 RepID=UPI00261EBE16|nr:hypothetical protein [uncultured Winogradskyella sp.]
MKRLLLFIILMNSFYNFAQETTDYQLQEYTLPLGESVSFENIRLEFKTLSVDSRCPKEVTCVRAGEVIATINVYVDTIFKKEFRLIFYPYSVLEQLTEFLETENVLIKNLKLFPYPKADEKQVNSNYYLQLDKLIVD